MQLDMHYYGTYALARLAGIKRESAGVIAYAAQYVDDAIKEKTVDHCRGAKLATLETAHHMADHENLDEDDQRFIWLPFHFLPGNIGPTFHERLICRKDSPMAQAMLKNHLRYSGHPFALALMGVTAHVFADTFSHYGFSGVSSPVNAIRQSTIRFFIYDKNIDTHVTGKRARFQQKNRNSRYMKTEFPGVGELATATAAESLTSSLGHGGAYTFPDRPYLHWQFRWEAGPRQGQMEIRRNQETFIEGCQKLHAFFRAFALKNQECREPGAAVEFGSASGQIGEILALEATQEGRITAWQEVMKGKKLGPAFDEDIPAYNEAAWNRQRDEFADAANPAAMAGKGVYQFYQAASLHRHFVLRELFPSNGLIVV